MLVEPRIRYLLRCPRGHQLRARQETIGPITIIDVGKDAQSVESTICSYESVSNYNRTLASIFVKDGTMFHESDHFMYSNTIGSTSILHVFL
jgi:hypothetical protein